MSAELNSAVRREPPKTDGVNPSNVRRFTSDNAVSKSNAVPAEWQGKYVVMFNESTTGGEGVRYLFSFNSAAVVNAVAAADNGAPDTALGALLHTAPVELAKIKLPKAQHGDSVFFVRRAEGGTPAITMELAE